MWQRQIESLEMRRLLSGSPVAQAASVGSIVGTVFVDSNADGQRGAGEQVLSGFRIYLDLNHNGKFDRKHEPFVRSGFTAIPFDGTFRLGGLAPERIACANPRRWDIRRPQMALT